MTVTLLKSCLDYSLFQSVCLFFVVIVCNLRQSFSSQAFLLSFWFFFTTIWYYYYYWLFFILQKHFLGGASCIIFEHLECLQCEIKIVPRTVWLRFYFDPHCWQNYKTNKQTCFKRFSFWIFHHSWLTVTQSASNYNGYLCTWSGPANKSRMDLNLIAIRISRIVIGQWSYSGL